MRFWDSSAIVCLLIEQELTQKAKELIQDKNESMIVWWGTIAECYSAICRLEREGSIGSEIFDQAHLSLNELSKIWHEIQPSKILRDKAMRLMRLHPLRTADSFQLAAALIATEDLSIPISFVCFDTKLKDAAKRQGFEVL